MCVAIYKPAGKAIPADVIRLVAKRNSHGTGLAVLRRGTFDIWRTLTDTDEAIRRAADATDAPAVMHFRFATHGKRDLSNVHPFFLDADESTVYAHNGVISEAPTEAERSDTRVFGDHLLAKLVPDWHEDPITVKLIENVLGHNKVILLRADGTHTLLNERIGMWTDGIWYSNTQHKGAHDDGHRALVGRVSGALGRNTAADAEWWSGQRAPLPSHAVVVSYMKTGASTVSPNVRFIVEARQGKTSTQRSVTQLRGDMPGAVSVLGKYYAEEWKLPPNSAVQRESGETPSAYYDLPLLTFTSIHRRYDNGSPNTSLSVRCACCSVDGTNGFTNPLNREDATSKRPRPWRNLLTWRDVRLNGPLFGLFDNADFLKALRCFDCGKNVNDIARTLYAAASEAATPRTDASPRRKPRGRRRTSTK